VCAQIGRVQWALFAYWMRGQTIGACPRGCSLYYRHDVENFIVRDEDGKDKTLTEKQSPPDTTS